MLLLMFFSVVGLTVAAPIITTSGLAESLCGKKYK